jgi:hypothetical protein
MRVRVVCGDCGGEDVVRDAWAAWDVGSQTWELHATLDAAFCHDCDTEVTLAELPELVS